VFGPYRALFAARGAWQFSAAGFVARLPLSMMGIGTVLMVSQLTGRYTLAGVVSGAIALSEAGFGPLGARLVDRFGQARVLRPFLLAFLVGVVALITAVRTDAPLWLWFAAAVLCGTLPQFGSLVRARWAGVLPAGAPRQTAFAFESVVDEVVFTAGPPLVTFLAVALTPESGLLAALGFAAAGGFSLAALRGTEPIVHHTRATHPRLRAVLRPGVLVVAVTFVGAGVVFGSVEVIVVAYADEQGHVGLAGLILAVWAAGSLLAGLVYGAVRWRRSVGVRFVAAAVAFGVAVLPFLAARSLPVLAGVMLLSGLSISPILIGGNALVEELLPPGTLTEGLAWTTTGLIVGVTAGAALSGPLIDRLGARSALTLPVLAGTATAVAGLAGSRWLLARRATPAPIG